MLIILPLLVIGALIFLKSPVKASLTIVALLPMWIEWKFRNIFGVSIGLLDAAIVGGLFGVLILHHKTQKDPNGFLKFIIWVYMVICIISSLNNPFLETSNSLKLLWVPYKAILVSLTFFLFYYTMKDKKTIQKAINLLILSSTLCCLIGIIQVIKQSPITFSIGTYGEKLSTIASTSQIDGSLRAFGTLWHSNDLGGF